MKASIFFRLAVITALIGTSAINITRAATSPEIKSIRVGYLPATHDSLLFIALEQKYFPANLTVELSSGRVSPDLLNKLRAKSIDIAIPGVAAPINSIGEGAEFCMVGGAAKESAAVVVRKDLVPKFQGLNTEQTLAAFSGLRVGSLKQSTGDAIFRMNIRGRKVLLQDSYGSPGELINDLKAAKLDAAVLWSPHMTIAEQQGVGQIQLWLGDVMPSHVCCRQVVRDEYLNDNRDAVAAYLSGLIKAMLYYSNPENKARVLAIVKKHIPTAEDVIEKELYGDRPRTTLSVDLDIEGIKSYASAMEKAELLRPEQRERVEQRISADTLRSAYELLGLTRAQAETAVTKGFGSVKAELAKVVRVES